MVDYLVNKDNIDALEAMEYIDYNVIRTVPYMGEQAPVIIYSLMN